MTTLPRFPDSAVRAYRNKRLHTMKTNSNCLGKLHGFARVVRPEPGDNATTYARGGMK